MPDSPLFSKINILYEDEHILAIDKPAGLMVHGDGRSDEPTLVDWILEKYPALRDVGEPMTLADGTTIMRPGIVHRLDRETSGVLLIAKTPQAHERLKGQFQKHTIEKIYRAFVCGVMKRERGVIDRPIGRSTSDIRQWSAQRGARGEMRQAITHYRVLAWGNGFSYLELRPMTGRTHQIRVHLKAFNHPVVGDILYGGEQGAALGFERCALHAVSIAFTLPGGARITVTAPLPNDFLEAEKRLVVAA